ncbi:MAG: hypothetical protein CMQ15_18460 [Gammaproteobacteria bacterium]|jgi:hypothetical protein|nr:hypothetical protein [Gammaproteobacteria bacterium]HJN96795.1 hypothetical protein [Gammaproteobacteria bacterium]|tara:strand:- start:1170 stop:1643 length:474 start_codon:yes stop_codon:yes gene_type:complete
MKKFLIVTSLLCVSQLVSGQQAGQSEIEEIIVIGELSKPAVRAQIIRVENDIYSFYNEHNGNPDLDILCREVAITGTRIPQRVCEPLFWTKARQRETRDFLHDFSGIAELEDLGADVIQETEEMNRIYAELIQQHPAFGEALLVLQDLKARLEELGN